MSSSTTHYELGIQIGKNITNRPRATKATLINHWKEANEIPNDGGNEN